MSSVGTFNCRYTENGKTLKTPIDTLGQYRNVAHFLSEHGITPQDMFANGKNIKIDTVHGYLVGLHNENAANAFVNRFEFVERMGFSKFEINNDGRIYNYQKMFSMTQLEKTTKMTDQKLKIFFRNVENNDKIVNQDKSKTYYVPVDNIYEELIEMREKKAISPDEFNAINNLLSENDQIYTAEVTITIKDKIKKQKVLFKMFGDRNIVENRVPYAALFDKIDEDSARKIIALVNANSKSSEKVDIKYHDGYVFFKASSADQANLLKILRNNAESVDNLKTDQYIKKLKILLDEEYKMLDK